MVVLRKQELQKAELQIPGPLRCVPRRCKDSACSVMSLGCRTWICDCCDLSLSGSKLYTVMSILSAIVSHLGGLWFLLLWTELLVSIYVSWYV